MHQPELIQVPVLVWGGGTGGAAAAIQAGRSGARTLLLTPGGWLGGMVSTAGVCCPDGNELSPWQSGLWGAFLRGLAQAEPEGLDHNWVSCFGYRPATAESLLRQWVHGAPNLEWLPHCRVLEVEQRGDRIQAIELLHANRRLRVEPRLVIDGSDRGDLLAHGIAHRLGWEPREQWDEPSAPPQSSLETDPFFAQQPVQSPTWVVMGQLPPGQSMPAVGGAMAAPFEQAAEAFGLEKTITYGRLPGGLVMLNWPLHGNDWHEGLERAFSGDPADEQALNGEMQAHSRRFSRALQEASGGWLQQGACFPTPGALEAAAHSGEPSPLQGSSALALMPYWREGRRLQALTTVVEGDLLPQGTGASIAALPWRDGQLDAIAVGNYANDHHYPGPDWPLAPKSCRWGGRWSGTPFCIPYGALVSSRCTNLLAADKGIGTSHMANGATRLQPLVMNVGQVAGLAAALCVQLGVAPADLPVAHLQQALVADPLAPAGPMPLWDTPWHHPDWAQRQRQALADPTGLSLEGVLQGASAPSPWQAPTEPGERTFSGTLVPDGEGGYRLDGAKGSWPVITLEPGLHQWLLGVDRPTNTTLIGCLNPWGPWIRASRLQADASNRS
ncbi:MAG: FAD-dependent oxidoreductase [Cyanobacteriota bacterium]|nr:FAD-dependent oxidoreductase [Cyanobacteriota bacterium]